MKKMTGIKWILVSSFFFGILNADADQQFSTANQNASMYQGTFQAVIKLNPDTILTSKNTGTFTTEELTGVKIISLLRLASTPETIKKTERIAALLDMGIEENDYSNGIEPFQTSTAAKDLAMNGVPALDQAQYGTCVTFSATAMLDALFEKGDFVDQQCSLAHNLFLGNDYWNGAWSSGQVIEPLQKYGIVEKNHCNNKYPVASSKISTDDYKKLVTDTVSASNVKLTYYEPITLDQIRKGIDAGNRIGIGFWLKGNGDTISRQGFDITINGQKRSGGLWACQQSESYNYCSSNISGGHAVVVTGYDDAQKLLKIRNSWGPNIADNGDFYMTYEFFNIMGVNGTEVSL